MNLSKRTYFLLIAMLLLAPVGVSAGCPEPMTRGFDNHFGIEFDAATDDLEITGVITYSATTTGSGTVQMFEGGYGIYLPALADIGRTLVIEVTTTANGSSETDCAFELTIAGAKPVIQCPGPRVLSLGKPLVIQILAEDFEVGNGIGRLLFSLGLASQRIAQITNDGLLTVFTEDPAEICLCFEPIELIVTDESGLSDTCLFRVFIPNHTPSIECAESPLPLTLWGDTVAFKVTATDSDAPFQQLSYSILNFRGPGAPTVNSAGEVVWATEKLPEFIGEHEIIVIVNDGSGFDNTPRFGNSDTCAVRVSIRPDFSLKIAIKENVLQGTQVDLPITLDDSYESPAIGGLDFLIDWDHQALSLTGITAGDFLENNEWEYFTFRFGPGCGSGCPNLSIGIVATAEVNDGMHHPRGFTNFSAGSSEIAILHFLVTNDRNFDCTFIPVWWKWESCGDNVLYSRNRDSVFVSSRVYEIDPRLIPFRGFEFKDVTNFQSGLPSATGSPDSCLNNFASATTLRHINFYNGGLDMGCFEIDARGDLNLNGLSNELADINLLCDFFIKGLSAYTVGVESQIAASDINRDGQPGELTDLVYMIRQFVGDGIPFWDLNHFSDTIKITSHDRVITTNTELGALLLKFEGVVSPTLLATDMDMLIGNQNGATVVLIKDIGSERIAIGEVVTAPSQLLSVEATDYLGNSLALESGFAPSPGSLPETFVLHQNYPNPFNPGTTIKIDFPHRSGFTLSFYNVRGQKVDEHRAAHNSGTLDFAWEPEGLPTGVYFYKLRVGSFVATKKLLLLR